MSERMTVHLNGQAIYEIVMENSFDRLGEELAALDTSGRKLCIVTDSNVAPLYLAEVLTAAKAVCAQADVFEFPAGEEYKTLDTVKNLYEFLILKQYDRRDMLIALGGGVTGDLCGYAAATYLRGIAFVQIPTTLLSQVDSSIGGKTGVDFDAYKNMVGAFHMPRLVYINSATLLTLDDAQFASGMGEVLKHGLIKDRAYYDWIWANREGVMARELDILRQLVWGSADIKRNVVEADPTEQGERALLNFGHTMGHAVEKLMNFTMFHGHCVGLGCLAAAAISVDRGMLDAAELPVIKERFAAFGLTTSLSGLDPDEVVRTTKNDKKMEAGTIKFILLRSVGEAYVDKTVTDSEMRQALTAVMSE